MWTRESLYELVSKRLEGHRLIVVANREPYIHRHNGDRIECIFPASGMATALDPVMRACGGVWIAHGSGNADRETVDGNDHVRVPPDEQRYTLRRVWLDKDLENGYYYGLANQALWPLCHIAFTRPVFDARHWECYRQVNQRFADAVLEEVNDEPTFVFVQDYHLALLPRLLKKANPNLIVAQFWHIPWPNRETFRAFPWKEELLDGLLGNDLLGFHLRYHCQNFLDTVDRAIEARVDQERSEITCGGKVTVVRPFPISIDFDEHGRMAHSDSVEDQMTTWQSLLSLNGHTLGIGIDRLDYTKGIPDRLRALDRLLAKYPDYRGKLIFAQVGVPSRSDIAEYRMLEEELDALVKEINARWSQNGWEPVFFLKDHFNQSELTALHRLADFCIVSSLHDGMNLVAKEFVASRVDDGGVLILSQFTGAARELTDAILINPFAVDDMADAIHRALQMPPAERQKRMKKMREVVAANTIYRWAGKIISALLRFEFPEPALSSSAGEASEEMI